MDFVIVEKTPYVSDNPFVFHFSGRRITERDKEGDAYFLGTLVGDPYQDEEFRRRLDRVSGRLRLKNIDFTTSVSRVSIKQVRRMDNDEKYKRKWGMVHREYLKRKEAALKTLFSGDAIRLLDEDYERTMQVLKERYNQ